MLIINNGELSDDQWQHIADETIPEDGRITVSLARWKAERDGLLSRNGELGVRLGPEDDLASIADDLHHFQSVAIEFPTFTDGRGFTLARMLRDRYGFQGEIRAMGDYLPDQIFFLSQIGVNAFELPPGVKPEEALARLTDFSVSYRSA